MIPFDGLHSVNDFPDDMPTLEPEKPKRWEPPADAVSREEWVKTWRPHLKMLGLLRDDTADDKPKSVPPMPNSKLHKRAKLRVDKPSTIPEPKKEDDDEIIPF